MTTGVIGKRIGGLNAAWGRQRGASVGVLRKKVYEVGILSKKLRVAKVVEPKSPAISSP